MSEVTTRPTEENKEYTAQLEQYATATRTKVVMTPADLDPKDKIMDEMLLWCKEQGDIVVLRSATILSQEPTSRTVQNCKSLLLAKGIHPGQVYAAVPALVNLILDSGDEDEEIRKTKGETSISFSDQQKHLRDLVLEAINENVSDIHIQVRQAYTRIRMRQHGELRVYAEWSEKLGREIASVAFNKETDHATSQ